MGNRAVALALTLLVAAPVVSEPIIYKVVPEESRFTVHVGKAGLFSVFGGHDHLIEVREYEGTVRWDADALESAQFVLEVRADSLAVADEDVSDEDRVQIQGDMETKALAVQEHSMILFESEDVELTRTQNGTYELNVKGNLDLRGVRAPIEVPLTLSISNGRLTATGELRLPSKRWGVPQISAVGGTVKTDDELELAFEMVAVRE